ncbi:nuclear transport factor 2 family protein [Paenibacillus soyae]|uniref:Nuclear transport factor 2 family protein n=1 Tax=Paenibacillus soyae TaxID=2969249 RepID=A0A9X2MRS1_9BACL|nr:nuclear transport factor 2 family protein [Paenibacillus soyae]MCR2804618.1 nuclear transport factor 2 family protein [Paenibacillus soyae]
MINEEIQEIIGKYVAAYNTFDMEGMMSLLHQDIVFRNFANGEMNAETSGIQEFRELAERSAQIFSSRCQTVTDWLIADGNAEVQIDYEAILAVDLPNGLKAGEKIQLKGKSVFEIFEGKIGRIEDYS